MAKILIDSNVIIDYFEFSVEKVQVFFDELIKDKAHIILSQQTIDEVSRKTEKKILDVSQNLHKAIPKINKETFSGLDVDNAIKSINSNLTLLYKKIDEDKEKKEKIIFAFLREATKYFTIFETSQEIINAARLRKEKGNPPSSGGSIGDEIIWESLLAWGKDDIVILSKDKTWHDNKKFLEYEYEKRNNKKLLAIESELSKICELLNLEESNRLKEIENAERELYIRKQQQILKEIITELSISPWMKEMQNASIALGQLFSPRVKELQNTYTLLEQSIPPWIKEMQKVKSG
ncbi:hypothetical protein R83H12_01786 [Fibrobacteria bacterium R8-3-H12]